MSYVDIAKRLRPIILDASKSLSDAEAYSAPELFPLWSSHEVAYKTDDRVQYDSALYKCLQSHTSQPAWSPDVAVSLWVKVPDPSQEWPEWVQPTGAHDAYNKGDKVSYDNKHWISDIDANVYVPGVYGWSEQ